MIGPNPKQQELIENTEGCYLVDAGPGTGKTFTITRRYAEIVEQDGVDPDDVLLITFTRSAATEMRDRIITHCQYGVREMQDAPIQTFHSLCNDILREYGFDAPQDLGINESVTSSTQLVDDETIEHGYFREFIGCFTDDHPEHHNLLRVVSDPTEILSVIKNLAAKGVFPTTDGWYRDCEEFLYGDEDAFKAVFEELNQPQNGGSRQSDLRAALNGYGGDACYLPDAPSKADIRGKRGSKSIPESIRPTVFAEDRADLVSFVHDVYLEYLEFALSRNYLNFAFLQLLAFVHCCETDSLHEQLTYEYVMIDEFQDTSEIQFKLALLLSETTNFCAVGDWKQSIYSFQYADVENITDFQSRLGKFVDDLNADRQRINSSFETIHSIELEQNYRSTQSIIDRSESALTVPGSSKEDVDAETVLEKVVSLDAETDHDHSQIEAIQHENEHEAVLTKIDEIVGNDQYAVRDDGRLRPPKYDDIAVLTRTRDFGRDLLAAAEAHGYPLAYEGGIELFRTNPAKILLAWLRILHEDSERGWAVVLEHAGYTLDEMQAILEAENYPSNMVAFRKHLESLETVSAVAHRVFEHYEYDGPTADVLRTTIQSVHNTTTLTRGALIRFIERNIESGSTHEVSTATGTNAVHVKTIHSAKGLEYPIVIMANMNSNKFPSSGGRDGQIVYDERFGLRQRTLYGEDHGQPHIYDNWRWDVLRRCRPQDYDEERRLLYVAMTRARDHLLFTAGEEPNTFLEGLDIPLKSYEPALEEMSLDQTVQTQFEVPIPKPDGPASYSPHSLMDDSVFEDVEDGHGTDFGSRLHEFAERYALGEDVEPQGDDQKRVQELLDSMDGELRIEESAYLPLEVDGKRVTIHGIVDLVHVTDDTVEILDYKTDRGRHAESEYRTQLSVYYHVLAETYPQREITASIFYTADGNRVTISPLSKDELGKLVRVQGNTN
jgi:ATP-dependent helicase/nuclease subunit A